MKPVEFVVVVFSIKSCKTASYGKNQNYQHCKMPIWSFCVVLYRQGELGGMNALECLAVLVETVTWCQNPPSRLPGRITTQKLQERSFS